MVSGGPYFVDVHVPQAVLCSDEPAVAPAHPPKDSGAVWYRAVGETVSCDAAGAVQAWHPEDGLGHPAYPVKPNTNNLRRAQDGGLEFEREVNCGLFVENGLVEANRFSCAVRYSSALGEARSLVTINPREENTYLFLAEKDGHIIWQDQQDQVRLSLPAPKGGGWVVAGYHDGGLSLGVTSVGQAFCEPVLTSAPEPALLPAFAGVSDVFIGCRSHRRGILKTLGSSRIHDLLLWIDRDCALDDPQGLSAACRYCESKGATG